MRHFATCLAIGIFCSVDVAIAAPLLRYTFDEAGSGSTDALDTGLAPAANGQFNGSATRSTSSPGGFGRVLDLTSNGAVDNFVATPGDVDKVDALSQMTLTMWINLQGAPQRGDTLLSDRGGNNPFPPAGTGGWEWRFTSIASAKDFSVAFGTTVTTDNSTGFFGVIAAHRFDADDRWLFMAVTFDETDSNGTMFYEGSLTDPVAQVGITRFLPNSITQNTSPLRVGKSAANFSSDSTPPVWIDDVRIYGEVLSGNELDAVRLENVPEPSGACLAVIGALTMIVIRPIAARRSQARRRATQCQRGSVACISPRR